MSQWDNMANNNQNLFPMSLYGTIVNNQAEARDVCLAHFAQVNTEAAVKAAQQAEIEASMYMEQGYSRSEAQFFVQGLKPCNSVSVFC